jgi:VIT1/CCC1 family predicted Fe2+/Mn2+ transporter
MPRSLSHREAHLVHRIGWLRAAVLGANDGLVSTASLIVGVAAASSGKPEIVVAGLAGLAAGAMSMAAGEYVSVSSQSDTEDADLERERRELADDPAAELTELAEIYKGRGVDPDLAQKVAEQLTASDALKAHAREELGITEAGAARPVQAALTSAATFAVGAALPLAVAVATPIEHVIVGVSAASMLFLAILGALSAWTGGAPMVRGTLRVGFWGIAAMVVTAAIGRLFGATMT